MLPVTHALGWARCLLLAGNTDLKSQRQFKSHCDLTYRRLLAVIDVKKRSRKKIKNVKKRKKREKK